MANMKDIIAAERAKGLTPGAGLFGKSPLADVHDTVVTPVPAAATASETTSNDRTRTFDLRGLAASTAAENPAGPAPAQSRPPEAGQLHVLTTPHAQAEAPPEAAPALVAPIEKPPANAPIEEPKKPFTLEEARAEINRLSGLVGTLFQIAVANLPVDVVEKVLPHLLEHDGLLGMANAQEDATTIVLGGKLTPALMAHLASDVRKGKDPSLLDEIASIKEQVRAESPDHVEILRTMVIGLLLNPDLQAEELGAFAKKHGAGRVKEVIEGLIADPSIVKTALIHAAAEKSGVDPAKVADPGGDLLAGSAAEWAETQAGEVIDAARNSIECWDQIIGGD